MTSREGALVSVLTKGVFMFNTRLLSIASALILILSLAACKEQEPTTPATGEAEKVAASPVIATPPPPPAPAKAGLPEESMAMALDEGDSKIPATITVPKGCTTFNDTPTNIRVEFGKMGQLFGVQVKEGNEFNTDLDKTAKDMRKNQYGNTNEILEESATLLRFTMAREGGKPSHKFRLLTELAGKKWVCMEGNYGGWSKELAERQLEACKTLAVK